MTFQFPTRSLWDEISPLPLAIGGILVVTLVVQLARPAPTPAVTQGAANWRAPVTRTVGPIPDYPQILAKSLFTPARGASDGAAQSASTSLADYTVAGVASVGGRGLAIFRGPGAETVSLRAGQALLGWRLASVSNTGIVLQQGDARRTVAVGSSAGSKAGAQ